MENTISTLPHDDVFDGSRIGMLGSSHLHDKEVPIPFPIILSKILNRESVVDIIVPSSTTRQHEFQQIHSLYTMCSQTNSWSHQFSSSLTNIRASVWNVRYHQGNGNILVQRQVHSSKFRASAPS